jgi:hypothetical protein
MKHDKEGKRRRRLCDRQQQNEKARPFAVGFDQGGDVTEDMPHDGPLLSLLGISSHTNMAKI